MKTITIDGVEYNLLPKVKFKVGDWVVIDNNHNSTYQVDSVRNYDYMLKHTHGGLMPFPFSSETRLRFWTIKDAKDSDVLSYQGEVFIARIARGLSANVAIDYDCCYDGNSFILNSFYSLTVEELKKVYPATKEQRDMFFKKMREVGYEWDEKKKELCKIIEPKFKVGDEIKTGNTIETIVEIDCATRSYCCESGRTIWFENQDLWHLAPKPHYDITNFYAGMPVLVRDDDDVEWRYVLFSHYRKVGVSFCAGGHCWYQCIPFERNEHLLGTTDMPSEEYINW